MENENEIWRDVPGYEGMYMASVLGNVKTIPKIVLRCGKYPFISKEKILKNRESSCGYLLTTLIKDKTPKTFTVHQIVAITFLNHTPCGHKLVINHKNFIKTDNRLDNLEIITQRENRSFKNKDATSKYVGVWLRSDTGKWTSQITINRKQITLGTFTNEYDAHLAYQNALLKYL